MKKMSVDQTWIFCGDCGTVPITSYKQIDALAEQYEAEVNAEGYTLDKRALAEWMERARDELKDAAGETS